MIGKLRNMLLTRANKCRRIWEDDFIDFDIKIAIMNLKIYIARECYLKPPNVEAEEKSGTKLGELNH